MDRQIAAHRYTLSTIDNLMPALRLGGTAATVQLVTEMRGSVEQHLRMAESIRAGLR